MPYGTKTADADPAKSLAIRQARADLVDRQAIATDVYKRHLLAAVPYVPQGLAGANEALKDMYGDGSGQPDAPRPRRDPRGGRTVDPRLAEPAVQRRPHYRPLVG